MPKFEIIAGDCLESLRGLRLESVNCCVTSPPYWGLRDYGKEGQLGLEESPNQYIANMVEVFGQVRRVLRKDGTLWLNLGDSYNAHPGQRKVTDKAGSKQQTDRGSVGAPSRHVSGLKAKDLIGIPWLVAFALRADGWYLRQDIIWAKPNPMPESVTDRCTRSHEYLFLLSKSAKYFYDIDSIREPHTTSGKPRSPSEEKYGNARGTTLGKGERLCYHPLGRNKRDVWTVAFEPLKGSHVAPYPTKLVEPCILAGCPLDGTVLDPFCGSGTTGVVALSQGKNFIGLELNPEYVGMARKRISGSYTETVQPTPADLVVPEKEDWLSNV